MNWVATIGTIQTGVVVATGALELLLKLKGILSSPGTDIPVEIHNFNETARQENAETITKIDDWLREKGYA